MDHSINLNTVKRPTFTVTMMDEENTTLRVKMPDLDMFKELEEAAAMVDDVEAGKSNTDSVEALYDFLAKTLSCNRDYKTVTADELRGKYGMELEDVILVYRAYVKFITAVIKEKN